MTFGDDVILKKGFGFDNGGNRLLNVLNRGKESLLLNPDLVLLLFVALIFTISTDLVFEFLFGFVSVLEGLFLF